MCEFRASFPAIVTRDIRHIYSGFPDIRPIARHANPFPTTAQLLQQREAQLLKEDVLRTSQFNDRDTRLYIPRAPAFRAFPLDDLRPITARLVKPTVASTVKRTKSDLEDTFTSNFKAIQHAKVKFPKFMGLRRVDDGELQNILGNVARPTVISDIKARVNNRAIAPAVAIETTRNDVYYGSRVKRGWKKTKGRVLLPHLNKVA